MSDSERLRQHLAKQDKLRAAKLDQARRAADKAGKERFDFARLRQLVDVSSFWGHQVDEARRTGELEEEYYFDREVTTLAQFADALRRREPFEP